VNAINFIQLFSANERSPSFTYGAMDDNMYGYKIFAVFRGCFRIS